jgi:hypothetical protein
MISLYRLLENHLEVAEKVILFFTAHAMSGDLYREIKEICKNNNFTANIRNHSTYLELGYLCKDDFYWYLDKTEQRGTGIPDTIVDFVLRALVANNIILELPSGSIINNSRPFYRVLLEPEYIKFLVSYGLIYNVILGFQYIYDRYRKSIFKIEVKIPVSKSDDYNLSIGTGFLLKGTNLIVTNKHVAEKEITKIVDESEQKEFNFIRENIKLSQSDDIALIPIDTDVSELEGLIPNLELTVLEEIITLGYPKIPLTTFPYLVAHKGEINSTVENWKRNSLFLISAKTSPGNSGGPILDKTGRFVGIVCENLFEEESFQKQGIIPYHAGVPAKIIYDFYESSQKS